MQDDELKEKFDEIYKTEIEPKLYDFEKVRLGLARKYAISMGLCIIAAVIGIICYMNIEQPAYYINEWVRIIIIIVAAGCVAIFYFLSNDINNKFRKKAKEMFLGSILSVFGEFKILEDSRITLSEIRSLEMYSKASTKDDDDSIIGEYKGKPVYFLETKLSHTEGSGKYKYTAVDFNGLIISTKIEKKFHGRGNLYSTDDEWVMKNSFFDIKSNEDVFLEDPEFNAQYKVTADDQIEIRVLFTPKFMEHIKKMKDIIGADCINLAFVGDHLYIFLNNICHMIMGIFAGKGLFEVGEISEKVTNKSIYENVFYELSEIFNFIDFINDES